MEMTTNAVIIISLSLDDMGLAIEAAKRFNLDFDDAYQYVSAEKYGLTLISFDSDFDRTERGRKLPSSIG
jgi:predicted nucleic acid-binding protein